MPPSKPIRTLFDGVAPWYDAMNRRMSLGLDLYWRRRAVELLPPNRARPLRFLDLATGTADLALAAARRKGVSVVGVDFSREMLRIAIDKIGQAGLTKKITLLQGDAFALPFPDRTFDIVGNAFLLRNLPDRPAAFAEMARVTKPGGALICLEIAYPSFPPWRALFKCYFERLVPLLGRWLTRVAPAYRYLPQSLAQFPSPAEVLATLEKSGWVETEAHTFFPGTVRLYMAKEGTKRG
jgi:demethylmenaquinone methyltransferase/2-methoxy-6-polyprenyl-1,4-benzoquinol methylase